MKILIKINILFFLSIVSLYAQDEVLVEQNLPAIDTVAYQEQNNRYTLFSSFGGKPGRAALYGLVAPAGGQFYNRKYIKGSIFLIGELGMIAFALDSQKYFNDLDADYKLLINGVTDKDLLIFDICDEDRVYTARASARQQKDYAWLGFGLVHLFVIAEAFVNRHLMEFDVTDDLSFKIKPTFSRDFISFTYQLN